MTFKSELVKIEMAWEEAHTPMRVGRGHRCGRSDEYREERKEAGNKRKLNREQTREGTEAGDIRESRDVGAESRDDKRRESSTPIIQ
jgi:hypothetical protein